MNIAGLVGQPTYHVLNLTLSGPLRVRLIPARNKEVCQRLKPRDCCLQTRSSKLIIATRQQREQTRNDWKAKALAV